MRWARTGRIVSTVLVCGLVVPACARTQQSAFCESVQRPQAAFDRLDDLDAKEADALLAAFDAVLADASDTRPSDLRAIRRVAASRVDPSVVLGPDDLATFFAAAKRLDRTLADECGIRIDTDSLFDSLAPDAAAAARHVRTYP